MGSELRRKIYDHSSEEKIERNFACFMCLYNHWHVIKICCLLFSSLSRLDLMHIFLSSLNLASFFVRNNNFYALFVSILLLVLCRQHILLHATIFLCKESYYRKEVKENFPRKVNKAIEEAELCASWLISFEEIQREREKDTQTRDIKSGGNLWMSWGITR